jgi:MoxR-like ATPase
MRRRQEEVDLVAVTDGPGLLALQATAETVTVDESVGRYCVDLVTATRTHPDVLTGASPRGSLGLVLAARAFALIRRRDYVIPEDVKAVAPSVLAHRVTVKPELWMSDVSGASVVRSVLAQVETPGAREQSPYARPGE